MKKLVGLLAGLLLVFGVVGGASAIPLSAETWIDNGNSYLVVLDQTKNWKQAKRAAKKLGGHLATITSQEEWDFVTGLTDFRNKLFLGGKQKTEPDTKDWDTDQRWKWITGEAWNFEAWAKNEPNDWPDAGENNQENYLETWYYDTNQIAWAWNDINNRRRPGYIVEFEATPVPEPATIMLFGLGLLGMAGISRKKE